MIKELSITVALIASAIVALFLYKKKHEGVVSLVEETIDGELKMSDLINYMKSLNLRKDRDIPFVAKGDCEEFRKFLHAPFPKKKEGYITIFVGVYNNATEIITEHKLIHSKSIDSDLQVLLANENLVVLQ